MAYTQKQIDKFMRQKYISELDKVAKNIFRMLRNENMIAKKFTDKLHELKVKLDKKATVSLYSEYHQQLQSYISRLHEGTCLNEAFTEKNFEDMRDAEMSNLNRLQKLKNATSYKKDKHKSKRQNEDWGE
ncbi:MAG: hypothetical protein Q9M36_01425 [Sulfurovum sp.]|nr:hypothetical protein [Sulfurovum sp.]